MRPGSRISPQGEGRISGYPVRGQAEAGRNGQSLNASPLNKDALTIL